MSDEKPQIKPGMKLRILNEHGRGRATRFFEVETGVELMPSGVAYPVKIDIPDGNTVNIELTMYRIPIDLVGIVVGMKMTEQCYSIEINPAEYDIVIHDAKDGLKRVYFERKK